MKILLPFFLLLFSGIMHNIYAQKDPKIEKSEFLIDKDSAGLAWDHVKKGNKYYEAGGGLYVEAINHYKKAARFNPDNAALNYRLGVANLLGGNQELALPYFLQSHTLDPDIAGDIILLTGRAYQYRGDYGKAIDCYNIYSNAAIENGDIDLDVNRYIRECNNAVEMEGAGSEFEVRNMGNSVNSSGDDYSPVISNDGKLLYFTSRRCLNDKGDRVKFDMKWDENIYLATESDGGWEQAGLVGQVNSEANEGIIYVNNENNTMLIYVGWAGNGDIYTLTSKKDKWSKPVPMQNGINSTGRETSLAFTKGGDEIYFTSDRKKGSFGGRDIYCIKRIKKNRWTKPFNLGMSINSPGNEEAVWASVTGDTLWFSSNGHEGIGGYDIFMSIRSESGEWTDPKNMGVPVNTQWDDLFYRPSEANHNLSYFSSNRPGGEGGLDIYTIRVIVSDSTNSYPLRH
ncbi:MAG: tetratricopeptide repeat protein [Bacteroidales bacterium]|nr:tetratricopeptide repeat protein [Bacteroidales bacterium]